MINLLLIFIGAIMLMYIDTSTYNEIIQISIIAMVTFLSRKEINVMHGALFVMAIVLSASLLQSNKVLIPNEMAHVWKNAIIYSTYLVFYLLGFFLMCFRPSISREILKRNKRDFSHIRMTKLDVLMISIFSMFILINFFAIVENFVRNLEHLGFSKVFSESFWGWDIIFHNYSDINRFVISLQIFAIISALPFFNKKQTNEKW